MKRINKLFISLALVLILALPMLSGCSLFGNNSNTNKASIEIHTSFKTEYEVGDSIDLTNGKIKYTDNQGTEHIVEIKQNMISSFSTETTGTRQMIVSYEGCDTLVNYSVYNYVDVNMGDLFYNNPASSIEQNPQNWYEYVKIIDENTISILTSQTLPENFEPASNTYMEYTKTRENGKVVYTIDNEHALIKITVLNQFKIHFEGGYKNDTSYSFDLVRLVDDVITLYTNFKTEYFVGDELDISSGQIEYTNKNGEKSIVAITAGMISGFSTNTVGSRQLTISYKNKTILVDYRVDLIKMGTYYYYYEGKLSEYSVEKEQMNTSYYIQFNADGTGIVALPMEAEFTWKYVATANKIQITATATQNIINVEIVSNSCVRFVYENQDWTHIFRHD